MHPLKVLRTIKDLLSDDRKTLQHEKSKELEEKEKCKASGLPYTKKCIR